MCSSLRSGRSAIIKLVIGFFSRARTVDELDDPRVCRADRHWAWCADPGLIGRDRRRTFYLLEKGLLPAKKVGGLIDALYQASPIKNGGAP
jgi:hypothetical protein